VAHESAEVFADLLTSKTFSGSATYHKWKDAFPIVYGATVEDLAQRYQERRRSILHDIL
jgi:hypothetical protein